MDISITYQYFLNLLSALCNKPVVLYKQRTVEVEKVVYTKDPHGLIKRDLFVLEKHIDNKPYKPGRTLEEVAYLAGQKHVLYIIEEKLIKPGLAQLK